MFELEDHYWWFVGRRILALRLLAEVVHGKPDLPDVKDRVLDLGCGTGVVSRELSELARPISLDLSERALRFCAERGLGRLVRGCGESLPFADASFAAVVALDIFEHIEDDSAAFREAFRVLRPGGSLVSTVPTFMSLWGPHDVALMHHRRYRRAELRKKLIEAGFNPPKVSHSVFFLFPLVLLIRLIEKGKKGTPAASLPKVPAWLNGLLIGLQSFEARLIHRTYLPWGSSLVAVATKTGLAEGLRCTRS